MRKGVELDRRAVAAELGVVLVDGRDGGAGPRCSASLAEASLARLARLGQWGTRCDGRGGEGLLILVLSKLGEVRALEVLDDWRKGRMSMAVKRSRGT